jgi:tRNA wybutosine-synthesizing protein 4
MVEVAKLSEAECYSMNDIYNKKLDKAEKLRIEKLEIFDEFEEWEMLQKHYCLCLGKRISDEDINKNIYI